MSQTKTFRFTRRAVSTITALTLALPLQLFAILPIAANATPLPPPVVLFEDGFESGEDFPLVEWSSADIPQWRVVHGDSYSGDHRAQVVGENEDAVAVENVLRKMVSTEGYEDLVLSYWVKIDENLDVLDEFRVEYTTDDGASWTMIDVFRDPMDINPRPIETNDGWSRYENELPSSADDNPDFGIRFVGNMDAKTSDIVYLDDVLLTGDKFSIQVFKYYDENDNGEYDRNSGEELENWEFCLVSSDDEITGFDATVAAFGRDAGFDEDERDAYFKYMLGEGFSNFDIFLFLWEEGYFDGGELGSCRETNQDGLVWWDEDIEGKDSYLLFERLGGSWEMIYFDYSQFANLDEEEGEVFMTGEGHTAFLLYEGARIEFTFGNYLPTGTVRAEKFDDENGNGRMDRRDSEDDTYEIGDPAIPGWEICLYDAGNGEVPTELVEMDLVSCQPTDKEGYVQWDDVPTGWYVLDEENRSNWTNMTDNDPTEPFPLGDGDLRRVPFGNLYTPPATKSGGGGGGPQAALSVTKLANPTIVNAGEDVAYTITLTNSGSGSVNNLVVTDILPPGLETGSTVDRTWTIDTIAPGDSETIEYTITVLSGATAGFYENTVSVTSINHGPVSASEVVEVFVPGAVLGFDALPNVSVVVTVEPPFATPGQQVTYIITVVNNGDALAENVVVTVELPDGFLEGTSSISSILGTVLAALTNTAQAAGLTFAVGDLAAGESWTQNVVLAVGSDLAPGVYSGAITVSADNNPSVDVPVDVEVREGSVLGFDTIPETGGAPGAMETLALVVMAVLALYAAGVYGFLRRKRVWSVTRI